MSHVDLRSRLRHIVEQAVEGCIYDGSHREAGGALLIDAHRLGGVPVHLRFRGVQDSESTDQPEPGAVLKLRNVGSAEGFSIVGLFLPRVLRGPSPFAAKVSLEAGSTRMEIVCQDVEWWEDDEPPLAADERTTGRP